MAGSVNKVILIGNLGRDPEIRFTQEGLKVASFSVATGESWKDKATGEKRDKTEWHRVVVMNERLSDIAEKYMKKGSKVYIEGQLQTRKWNDASGQERYTTEILLSRFKGDITLLDSRSGETLERENTPSLDKASGNLKQRETHDIHSDLDDDIPF